jgi:omega-amidase
MKDLRITLVQTALHWEDNAANRTHFAKEIKAIRKGSTDLIVLPEMFTSGFTMNPAKVSETMKGETVSLMLQTAKDKQAVICGSLVIAEKKNYYNRLIWAQPDGKVLHYDKRHLFRMADEHLTYTAGEKRKVFLLNGWRICPLICYDLRFPVWSRNNDDYDVLIYVANWPKRRNFAWKQLLIARAIENQCYTVGLNRIGTDGKNIPYSGDSVVLDPLGKKISNCKAGAACITTVTLAAAELSELRAAFPVSKDADKFTINN